MKVPDEDDAEQVMRLEVKSKLVRYFRNFPTQLKILSNEQLGFERGIYSPKLDIAIGPIAKGVTSYVDEYDEVVEYSRDFLTEALELSLRNTNGCGLELARVYQDFLRDRAQNKNARCSIAIEIENSGSEKHTLGDVVNACSLGRVAFLVGYENSYLPMFIRILKYLQYLRDVEKPTYFYGNAILLEKDQFLALLNKFCSEE